MNLRQRRRGQGSWNLVFELGGGCTSARSDFDRGEIMVCGFCKNRERPMREFIWRRFRGVGATETTESRSILPGRNELVFVSNS
jgi:hypothetical protein